MAIFRYYPEESPALDKELEKKIIRHSFLFAFFFVALFWIVEIIGEIFGLQLFKGGIYPLLLKGLPGIITSPFIHSGFKHLISNTIPFFILLFALVYYYRKLSYRIFFQLYILAGICVWLAARPAWHIGASGVVYALAAFHFTSGIIRNDLRLLVLAIVVVFLYGGMVWGVLPIKPEVSWESHLWGALSGIIMAFRYRNYHIFRKKFEWEDEEAGDEKEETPLSSGIIPEDSLLQRPEVQTPTPPDSGNPPMDHDQTQSLPPPFSQVSTTLDPGLNPDQNYHSTPKSENNPE